MKLDQIKRCMRSSSISDEDKMTIQAFDDKCLLEGLSLARRIRIISILKLISEKYLEVDFKKATLTDLKSVVIRIESRQDFSPWTKQTYKSILKKFYKWLEFGEDYKQRQEYPKIVSWINTNIKKTEQPKVDASDIFTEDEIERLIKAAEHPRDKALIATLYELGARIGEIGNLSIRSISQDKYSYLIDLRGKTGKRTPRIVMASPYVRDWLNAHPDKNNPDAPLWVMAGKRTKDQMMYGALRIMVKRLSEKAGIKKRVYPHLFRHTRVTHLLMQKQINESQAKIYFGWVPSSNMLSEYSHLVSSDVNDAILEMHGIKRSEQSESKLKPKQCSSCGAINASDARFCNKCTGILDVRTAIKLDEKRRDMDDALSKVLRKMMRDSRGKEVLAEIIAEEGLTEKLIRFSEED